MNMILIGFASTGKTHIGKVLARKIKCPFFDLDNLVESSFQQENGRAKSCRDIYQSKGEAYFRALETKVLENFLEKESVLATGGGAPMDSQNQNRLTSIGTVIYLHATPDAIWKRMQKKGAPAFLSKQDPQGDLRRLWKKRHSVYKRLANLTVETDEKEIDLVVQEITQKVE